MAHLLCTYFFRDKGVFFPPPDGNSCHSFVSTNGVFSQQLMQFNDTVKNSLHNQQIGCNLPILPVYHSNGLHILLMRFYRKKIIKKFSFTYQFRRVLNTSSKSFVVLRSSIFNDRIYLENNVEKFLPLKQVIKMAN